MGLPLDLVDVFAARRFQGNQLAVVGDAGGLDAETMQAIARETNFSETTFVTGGSLEGGFDVRIFTPTYEMPFAGHPTLGTAWVLRRQAPEADEIHLNLAVGQVPVRFESELAWLTSPPTRLGEIIEPELVSAALGLELADLDPDYPARLASSGPDFLIVPLADLEALERARLDLQAFAPIEARGVPRHVYPIARGAAAPGAELTVRLFFDAAGLREDPATGSAACCLGAYLRESGYLGGGPIDVTLAQGDFIGRPSRLRLRAAAGAGAIEVGGAVVAVARGELIV